MGCCKFCQSYAFWYILLCDIAYSLCYFYRNSIVAITDALQKDFKTDASGIGYLASFIFASYFCMQLIIGLLLEIYSFQLLLFLGAFGLGLTSLLFGIAENIIFATFIRFVAGIALAPLFLTGITIGAQRYGTKYVGLVTGILLFSSQSLLSGLVTLQAWLYDKHGRWREVFYIMGFIAFLVSFIVAVIAIIELKEIDRTLKIDMTKQENKPQHLKRSVTAPLLNKYRKSMMHSSFSQSLIFRPDRETKDSKVQKILQSLKTSLCYSVNWILGLQQFSLRSITYALNGLWIIAYLRVKFNYSPEIAASISGVFFISSSFGSLISGKLMQVFHKRKIFLIIGVILSQFCVIFIYGIPHNSNWNKNLILIIIYASNVVSGFGAGFLPVGFTMARELNDKKECSDTATGMVNMLGNAAGFISQLIVSSLIDVSFNGRNGTINDDGERDYTVDDYQFAFIFIPITGVIGLIMSIIISEPKKMGSIISLSSFIMSDNRNVNIEADIEEAELSTSVNVKK
eukprot:186981_1